MPSSPIRMMPCSALENRWLQLSRIFSNTGLLSATELLMTCSTSEVAVCCSRASLVSLKCREFSIAITAWAAKVCSSSTALSGNAPASGRVTVITPTIWSSRRIGTASALR